MMGQIKTGDCAFSVESCTAARFSTLDRTPTVLFAICAEPTFSVQILNVPCTHVEYGRRFGLPRSKTNIPSPGSHLLPAPRTIRINVDAWFVGQCPLFLIQSNPIRPAKLFRQGLPRETSPKKLTLKCDKKCGSKVCTTRPQPTEECILDPGRSHNHNRNYECNCEYNNNNNNNSSSKNY